MHILYSYRRCPYAMRARMALTKANIAFEIREISFRDKPSSLLQVSPKGTVPVLVLEEGDVIDESIDIVFWALTLNDPDNWLAIDREVADALIAENDGDFKINLDRYKYPERFPDMPQADYRARGETFLQKLEKRLNQHQYLMCDTVSVADIAIFPFIRQFANVDRAWFDTATYPRLRDWLNALLAWDLFEAIMKKQPTYLD